MRGDFSRLPFDPTRHLRNALLQQGRMLLDSDWNDQQLITAHRTETAIADAIGRSGAPAEHDGFRLDLDAAGNTTVGPGRYYVEGLLCENETVASAPATPSRLGPAPSQAGVYLIYIDAWLRHVTALDDPRLREPALGGPDTATRLEVDWQVKFALARPIPPDATALAALDKVIADLGSTLGGLRSNAPGSPADPAARQALIVQTQAQLDLKQQEWQTLNVRVTAASRVPAFEAARAASTGTLTARTTPAGNDKPCLFGVAPGFQGVENQLYRVEIHDVAADGTATWKWSRDNGSVAALVTRTLSATELEVAGVDLDDPSGLVGGIWVELLDADDERLGRPGPLLQVVAVNPARQSVTIGGAVPSLTGRPRPRLRRWDSAGVLPVNVPATNGGFLPLESGIEVLFSTGTYRAGDSWMIPARVATGDILWPPYASPNTSPAAVLPWNADHRHAPIGVLAFDGTRGVAVDDQRVIVPPLTGPCHVVQVATRPGSPVETPLQPGDVVPSDSLAEGLCIVLDRRVDPVRLPPAACAVLVDFPVPAKGVLTTTPSALAATTLGVQPMALSAQVRADNLGGLTWTPLPNVQYLLRQGLTPFVPANDAAQFASDWEINEPGNPPTIWGYNSDGTVVGGVASTTFSSILSRSPLDPNPAEIDLAGTLPASNTDRSFALIFNSFDPRNYAALYYSRSSGPTGMGGNSTRVAAGVRVVSRGEEQDLSVTLPDVAAPAAFRATVKQASGKLIYRLELTVGAGAPTVALDNRDFPGGPTQLIEGSRVGVQAGLTPCTITQMRVVYPSGALPLVPPLAANRLIARLAVRRNLLRPFRSAEPSAGSIQPAPDFETWFYLAPPRPDYGYGSGSGVFALGPGFTGYGAGRYFKVTGGGG